MDTGKLTTPNSMTHFITEKSSANLSNLDFLNSKFEFEILNVRRKIYEKKNMVLVIIKMFIPSMIK